MDEESLRVNVCFSEAFEDNVSRIWDFNSSVDQYQTTGGTSLKAVQQQINNLRSWLRDFPYKKY